MEAHLLQVQLGDVAAIDINVAGLWAPIAHEQADGGALA